MTNSIDLNGNRFDLQNAIDISIPLRFNGPQPNAYGVAPAVSKPVEAGEMVGDTRRGGSVNFEQYTFIPHCSGTHTECAGHITHERISVRDCLKDVFIPAVLVSVTPENNDESEDLLITRKSLSEPGAIATGFSDDESDDLVITRKSLSEPGAVATGFSDDESDDLVITRKSLSEPGAIATGFLDPARGRSEMALIVRTNPNDSTKLTREYGEDNIPPYFTRDAMQFIVDSGFKHLLVDTPSIDRIYDEGKLLNHRLFWNVGPGSFEVTVETRINKTITELIYVPSEIPDGEYLLNLQIAPFDSDCAPSRPILIKRI